MTMTTHRWKHGRFLLVEFQISVWTRASMLVLGLIMVTRLPCVHSVCSQFIALSGVSSQGNITSPGYPAPYPPDALCQYKLQGEAWQGIKITFLHFDLEPRYSAGCLNDYLEINTVDVRGQRTFLGRFCGMNLPGPILVLHPTAELVFRSNHAVHSNGFMATYEFVDEMFVTTPRLNATSPCGDIVQGIGGTVVSPGYPRGYAAGLDCLWLIRVKYNHAIYVRVQHLEFQGSTANCQKAQLRIYDGYEHSLEDHTVLKKFCGDTRFYKGDDEKVLLSDRNRLLIRFTTTEPSKPVNDSDANVGFRLVWSDVEFDTAGNCTKSSRFPCKEAQICFTHHHKGGTSSCPDLRHYCISKELVCDGISHCGETDPSDERNCSCYKAPIMLTVVAAPLAVLTCGLCICFCWFTRSTRRRERQRRRNNAVAVNSVGDANNTTGIKGGINKTGSNGGGAGGGNEGSCCDCCCISSSGEMEGGNGNHKRKEEQGKHSTCHSINAKSGTSSNGEDTGNFIQNSNAPITRGPIFFKNDLESPGASDIVSPASGFSDTESELGSQIPIYCPAHGPIPMIPVRYLNRHFPMLPAVQEQAYQSDTYDEGGSTYSSGQNSDQIMICSTNNVVAHQMQQSSDQLLQPNNKMCNSSAAGIVNEWRLRRGVQRSDAIYISDDGKSSIASSPGRICPRCMEKERDQSVNKSVMTIMEDGGSEESNLNNLGVHHRGGGGGGGGGVSTGMQFDSGIIDVGDCSMMGDPSCGGVGGGVMGGGGGAVKNVSFETCTSSDSAISTKGSRSVSWNKPCSTVSILPSRFKHSNNVIEEVTSQSQNSSSSRGSGGGTNQGIQTDLPSPPPSTTSQDDNNTLMDEMIDDNNLQHHTCPCMAGNPGGVGMGGGGSSGAMGGGMMMSGGGGGRTSSAFCVTVTTFGVTPSGSNSSGGGAGGGVVAAVPTTAKATDV